MVLCRYYIGTLYRVGIEEGRRRDIHGEVSGGGIYKAR